MSKFKLFKKKNLFKNLAVVLSLCLSFEAIVSRDVFAAQESRAEIIARRTAYVRNLQNLLRETNATWTAEQNEFSEKSEAEIQNMMGLFPAEDRSDTTEIDVEIVEDEISRDIKIPEAYEVPNVTPVKNQGNCGCCYAFASNSMLETYMINHGGVSSRGYDLSEQDLMTRAKEYSNQGYGGCDGWFSRSVIKLLQLIGVTTEVNKPYIGKLGSLYLGNEFTKMGIVEYTSTKEGMKTTIYRHKTPLLCGMWVFSDFMSYRSGVYRNTGGSSLGGHAVCIVGYDDSKQAFKVKNSWGTGWGEGGFFWIGYDQMDSAVQFTKVCGGGAYGIKSNLV